MSSGPQWTQFAEFLKWALGYWPPSIAAREGHFARHHDHRVRVPNVALL
jgi:hypothetical protein